MAETIKLIDQSNAKTIDQHILYRVEIPASNKEGFDIISKELIPLATEMSAYPREISGMSRIIVKVRNTVISRFRTNRLSIMASLSKHSYFDVWKYAQLALYDIENNDGWGDAEAISQLSDYALDKYVAGKKLAMKTNKFVNYISHLQKQAVIDKTVEVLEFDVDYKQNSIRLMLFDANAKELKTLNKRFQELYQRNIYLPLHKTTKETRTRFETDTVNSPERHCMTDFDSKFYSGVACKSNYQSQHRSNYFYDGGGSYVLPKSQGGQGYGQEDMVPNLYVEAGQEYTSATANPISQFNCYKSSAHIERAKVFSSQLSVSWLKKLIAELVATYNIDTITVVESMVEYKNKLTLENYPIEIRFRGKYLTHEDNNVILSGHNGTIRHKIKDVVKSNCTR